MDVFGKKSGALKRPSGSKPDTLLFLTIFALGFLAISFFNVGIDRPTEIRGFWDIATRILIPCILLIVYACLVWLVPKFVLKSEQAGDNCYYLGFIFTLVSLAFALYDFVGGSNRTLIVQDFGIALSTTIVGLLLRVLFSQSRLDPEHVESAARETMSKSARDMRDELHRVVIDFNSFRRYYQQSLNDSLRENQTAITELQSRFSEQQTKATEEWSNSIASATEEFTRQHQLLIDTIEKTTTVLGKFADSLESKSAGVGEARNEFDELNTTMENTSGQLTKLSEALDEELIVELAKFKSQILAAQAALEENKEPLNESVVALKRFLNDLNQMEPTLRKLSKSARKANANSRKSFFGWIRFWSKPS